MEHRHKLKECLHVALRSYTAIPNRQRQDEIGSLMTDALLEGWDESELAVQCLNRLATGDDSKAFAVCLAVVDYLDIRLTVPHESRDNHDRLKALAQIVKGNHTELSFREWIQSWYF